MNTLSSQPATLGQVAETVRSELHFIKELAYLNLPSESPVVPRLSIIRQIKLRFDSIFSQLSATLDANEPSLKEAVELFSRWMTQGKIIRVVGAGRARLAAAIPANRLAHGGAQVYVQDDIIPMPHTIRGGGLIAVSASGKTESVLSVLHSTRKFSRDVEVVGIASRAATEFASVCDVFIGIEPPQTHQPNPLRALADTEEYVISELLDSIVVSAGQVAGFDDAHWRLGHEDIGATGPYNFAQRE